MYTVENSNGFRNKIKWGLWLQCQLIHCHRQQDFSKSQPTDQPTNQPSSTFSISIQHHPHQFLSIIPQSPHHNSQSSPFYTIHNSQKWSHPHSNNPHSSPHIYSLSPRYGPQYLPLYWGYAPHGIISHSPTENPIHAFSSWDFIPYPTPLCCRLP